MGIVDNILALLLILGSCFGWFLSFLHWIGGMLDPQNSAAAGREALKGFLGMFVCFLLALWLIICLSRQEWWLL